MTRRARVLRVAVTDARGKAVGPPWRAYVAGLAGWLARIAPAGARGVVNVALVSDAWMRSLNRKFRRRDAPTDVLSFPNQDFSSANSPSCSEILSSPPGSLDGRLGAPGTPNASSSACSRYTAFCTSWGTIITVKMAPWSDSKCG